MKVCVEKVVEKVAGEMVEDGRRAGEFRVSEGPVSVDMSGKRSTKSRRPKPGPSQRTLLETMHFIPPPPRDDETESEVEEEEKAEAIFETNCWLFIFVHSSYVIFDIYHKSEKLNFEFETRTVSKTSGTFVLFIDMAVEKHAKSVFKIYFFIISIL